MTDSDIEAIRNQLEAVQSANWNLKQCCLFLNASMQEREVGRHRRTVARPVAGEWPGETPANVRDVRPDDELLHVFEMEWARREIGWPSHLDECLRLKDAFWREYDLAANALRSIPPDLEQKLNAADSGVPDNWVIRTQRLLVDSSDWCHAYRSDSSSYLFRRFVESLKKGSAIPNLGNEEDAFEARQKALRAVSQNALPLRTSSEALSKSFRTKLEREHWFCNASLDSIRHVARDLERLNVAMSAVWR